MRHHSRPAVVAGVNIHPIRADCNWPITNCPLRSVAITCRPLSGNESPIGSTDPVSAPGGPSRPWPAGPGPDAPVNRGAVLRPGSGTGLRAGSAGAASSPVPPDRVLSPAQAGAAGSPASPAPGPARGGLGGGPCPAASTGIAVTGNPGRY